MDPKTPESKSTGRKRPAEQEETKYAVKRAKRNLGAFSGISPTATLRFVRARMCVLCRTNKALRDGVSASSPSSLCFLCAHDLRRILRESDLEIIRDKIAPKLVQCARSIEDTDDLGAFPYAYMDRNLLQAFLVLEPNATALEIRRAVYGRLATLLEHCTRLHGLCTTSEFFHTGAARSFADTLDALCKAVEQAMESVGDDDEDAPHRVRLHDDTMVMCLGTYVALGAMRLCDNVVLYACDLLMRSVRPETVLPLDEFVGALADGVIARFDQACEDQKSAADRWTMHCSIEQPVFGAATLVTARPPPRRFRPQGIGGDFLMPRVASTLHKQFSDICSAASALDSAICKLDPSAAFVHNAALAACIQSSVTRDLVVEAIWREMPYRTAEDAENYKECVQVGLDTLAKNVHPIIEAMTQLLAVSNMHPVPPSK